MKTSNHHLISVRVAKAIRGGASLKPAFCFLLAAIFAGLAQNAQAASTNTWNGTTDNSWSTGSDWSLGSQPLSGDTAIFNNAGNTHTSLTLGSATSIGSITFDTGSAAAYTIGTTTGPILTLASGGIIQTTASVANIETINAPITLGGAYTFSSNSSTTADVLDFGGAITLGSNTLTLSGTNTGANTISGAIGGTGGLTLNGLGTWELSGNNGYTGATAVGGGGTLEVVTGSGGAIVGGKALTLTGGEFDYNGTGNTATLTTGTASISSGANTIEADGSATTLTLGGVTRTIGATVNFVTTNSGTIDASSGIAFNQGEFFDGSNYAYATANGAIGAVVYGTTLNAFNVSGALSTASNTIYQITGASSVNGINIGSGTIKFGGAYTLSTSGTTPSTIGGFLVSGVNGTISGSGGLRENGDMVFRTDLSSDTLTVGAPIAEFNATVAGTIPVKTGAGTLTLSGTNSYIGNTFVNQGTLTALSSSALGFGGNVNVAGLAVGTTTVNAGGTLDLDGATSAIVVDEPIILSGGSLVNNSTANATTLDSGVAGLKFTSIGSGYTAAGTVTFSSGNATGTASVAQSGTGAQAAVTNAGNGYTTAPTFTVTGGNGSGASGTTVLSSLALNGTANTIGGVGSMNINAAVTDGTAGSGFTKTGTGTVVLTGLNTYSGGTTVSGGNLELISAAVGSTSSATGTGTVAVSGGTSAVVSGTGQALGAVAVTNGSHLAPGVNTSGNFGLVGTLGLGTSGGLTLGNANLDFDLGTTAAGPSDVITTAALTLGTLNFNLSGTTLQTGTAYDLINDTSESGFNASNISTTFLGPLAGAYTAQYSIAGGTNGTDLEVTFASAAPEPSTVALMLGGVGFLFLWVRRRSRLVS